MLNKLNSFFFPKIAISYNSSKEHISALDGLRGFAILLVLSFHTFHFMLGWCGVDLFFVLSGFLITGILIDSKESDCYFSNFLLKRVLRIFPLYYLVLAIIIVPKLFWGLNTVSYTSWTYWFYLQNWAYIFNGVFPDGRDTLNHFWSLAIEEQFYFLFPFIVKYIDKGNIPAVLLSLICVAIGTRYFHFSNQNIGYYVGTLSRMDSLSLGALVAYAVRFNRLTLQKWTLPFFYLSLIYIVSISAITQSVHFSNPYFATFGLTLFAVFFAALLVFCILENNFVSKMFNIRALKFIGKISYGLYIYHWILYVFMKPTLEKSVYNTFPYSITSKIITSILIIAFSILLSYFSFHYFEKPIINLKKTQSKFI
ncbi:MAG TPA: acyltransferase [Pelobium sp.]